MQPAILMSPHFYTARDQFRKPPFGEDVMLCSAAGPVCSAYSQILLQCVACHFTLAIGCCCGKTAQLMSDKEGTGCSCSCGTCCTCRHVQLSDSHANTHDFVHFRPKDNCKKRSETTNAQRPKKNRHADCLSRVKERLGSYNQLYLPTHWTLQRTHFSCANCVQDFDQVCRSRDASWLLCCVYSQGLGYIQLSWLGMKSGVCPASQADLHTACVELGKGDQIS